MNEYFTRYLHYTSQNMAAPKLHEWACIMTIATALSRKVWFQQGDWRIYPNLYVFFVGAPGDRKSTAMELAARVIHDFTDIQIAPDQITREALTQFMQKKCGKQFFDGPTILDYSPITVFSDELVILLGPEPIRMIELLTSLWNNPTTFKVFTKNMGNDEIVRPCVNLLGCITPSTMNNMMQQNLISGGFCRRMILVYTKKKGPPLPFPEMTEAHYESKRFCVEYAKKAQELTGPFSITPDAKEFFSDWYINIRAPQEESATTDVMRHWYSTKDGQLLKVSMCLAVTESLDKVIKLHHVQKALDLLDETEPDIMSVLGGAGRNELAPVANTVKLLIEKHPDGITLAQLKGMTFQLCNAEELNRVLEQLTDTEVIARTVKNFPNGKSVFVFYPPKP